VGAEAKVYITAKDMTGPGLKKAGTSMRNFGRKMSMFVTAPLAILGGIALKTAADFEKQQVAFETMLGSVEKAKVLLKDIIDFSAKTPFKLPGLQDAAKRLLGFGIEADKVVSTLRNLGNVAQGDQERLDRLTLAFGKLRAKGKATLEELNMFLEAGVPILDELSSMYNVTTQEMFEMISKGKIGFGDVNTALINLSTGTGKFAGMLEKQSQTLSGLFSTIIDNLKLLGMEMMQTIMPQIKAFARKILELVERFRELNPEQKKMIVIFAGIAAAIGPVIMVVGLLITALGAVMSPIGLVIMAVAALATAGFLIYKHWEKVKTFFIDLWTDLAEFAQQIFLRMKKVILTPVQEVLEFLLKIASAFKRVFKDMDLEKLQGALDKINGKIEETDAGIEKLRDQFSRTGGHISDAGEKIKELAGKFKNGVIGIKELIKGLKNIPGPAEEAALAMEEVGITASRIVEQTENFAGPIARLNDQIHETDNAMFAAAQDTDIYSEAMRRLEDRCRILEQEVPKVTDPMDKLTEKIREAEEALENTEQFVREHWAPTWELMGNAALSAEEKVKEAFKNIFVDVLRMLSRYLFELGAAHLIPGLMFNPAAGIGYLAASAATSMAAGFIQSLGQGGIVTQPTLALVGESGPEAVVPLNKSSGIGPTIIVHVYGSVKTEKDIAVTIAEEMQRQGYIA